MNREYTTADLVYDGIGKVNLEDVKEKIDARYHTKPLISFNHERNDTTISFEVPSDTTVKDLHAYFTSSHLSELQIRMDLRFEDKLKVIKLVKDLEGVLV